MRMKILKSYYKEYREIKVNVAKRMCESSELLLIYKKSDYLLHSSGIRIWIRIYLATLVDTTYVLFREGSLI